MLVPLIDDAHLMPADLHNLVLIGQQPLLQSLSLSIHEEIRSRVTYSVVLPRLAPQTIEQFVLTQLDRAGRATTPSPRRPWPWEQIRAARRAR